MVVPIKSSEDFYRAKEIFLAAGYRMETEQYFGCDYLWFSPKIVKSYFYSVPPGETVEINDLESTLKMLEL